MTTSNLTNINTSNLKRVVLIGIAINVIAGLYLGAGQLLDTSAAAGARSSAAATASTLPAAPTSMTFQEPFGTPDTSGASQDNKH
jgi:hypothetical protein